jgi:hypothetical protein
MFATDDESFAIELVTQHTGPHERMFQMQFIYVAHELKVNSVDWFRLVINTASTYTD